MLDPLAELCSRRPLPVLAAGLAVLAVTVLIGQGALGKLPALPLADSEGEAARAERILAGELGYDPDPALLVRVLGDVPLTGPDGEIVLDALTSQAEVDPDVGTVRRAGVSPDGLAAGLLVYLREGRTQVESEVAGARLREDFDPGPLRLEIGGRVQVLGEGEQSVRRDAGDGLFFGLALATLLLVAGFAGSFLAALGAVLVGGIAVAGSFSGLRLLDGIGLELGAPALAAAGLLGAVLAIEHSRMFVSAYSDSARLVGQGPDALALAGVEAGRATAAASAAAVAALLPMLLLGVRPLADIVLAGALAAILAAAAAIVLLPALLSIAGGRVLGVADPAGETGGEASQDPVAKRVSGRSRVALGVLLASVVALAALGIQAPGGSVGFDASGLPAGSEARVAEAGATRTLGPGLTAPAVVAVDQEEAEAYAERAAQLEGVAGVEDPQPAGSELAMVEVRLATPPGSIAAQDTVESLRALPGDQVVGGRTAALIDSRDSVLDRLPAAVGLALLAVVLIILATLRAATGIVVGLPLAAGLAAVTTAPLAAGVGALTLLVPEGRLTGLLSYSPVGDLHLSALVLTLPVLGALGAARSAAFAAALSEERQSSADRSDAIASAAARLRGAQFTSTVVAAALLAAIAFRVEILAAKEAALLAAAVLFIDLIARLLAVPALARLLTRP